MALDTASRILRHVRLMDNSENMGGSVICTECDAILRRVGQWAGMWILACTRCTKTILAVKPAKEGAT